MTGVVQAAPVIKVNIYPVVSYLILFRDKNRIKEERERSFPSASIS